MRNDRCHVLVFSLLMLSAGAARAAGPDDVIGWWRFDGPLGKRPQPGQLRTVAGKDYPAEARPAERGALRFYHETPGRYVYDPLTGKALANDSSLLFASGRGDSQAWCDCIRIGGGIGKLRPKSFTIEGFMKSGGDIDKWHTIIALRDPKAPHPHAWSLSTENLRGGRKLRFGGHKAPRGYWASYQQSPDVRQPGWHHFAYVYEPSGETHKARLYWDGKLVSEVNAPPLAWEDSQELFIGGGPGQGADSHGWIGYLDEVRYTAAALKPEQFLQASDTDGKPGKPATPIALGLRPHAPEPLTEPVKLSLPAPKVGPAEVHVPSDANLINVKTAYDAKGDGMTDDTAAIRRAVSENIGKHKTLHFPPGVYVISGPIEWKGAGGKFNAFLTWQGAGMGRTFIYLRPGAAGFGDAGRPEAMTRSGSIGTGGTGGGNRAHNNYIMDMTFVVAADNPGAIGVDFCASNTGAVENVRIVALDAGVEGLRLTRHVGPQLIRNVEVHGFDVGVHLAAEIYGTTLSHLRLAGQKRCGLLNDGHMVALERLVSDNKVPAVRSRGKSGLLVMIDSELTGGATEAAAMEILSPAVLRNVTTAGYGTAIEHEGKQAAAAGRVEEFVYPAPMTLFEAPARTLNLPVVQPPSAEPAPAERWANVMNFVPEGKTIDSAASHALQAAIDSGAAVVYLPHRTYELDKPVIIRGKVRRIVGYNSWLKTPEDVSGQMLVFQTDHPVSLERVNMRSGRGLAVKTDQPVVFKHIIGLQQVEMAHERATVFSLNTVGDAIALKRGQTWRARQLNIEKRPPAPMVDNAGGTFWVLGYKTEFGNTTVRTAAGGRSEVLGGLWYPAQGVGDATIAAVIVEDAAASVSFVDIAHWDKGKYTVEVRETRDGATKQLTRDQLPIHWARCGSLALFRSAAPPGP